MCGWDDDRDSQIAKLPNSMMCARVDRRKATILHSHAFHRSSTARQSPLTRQFFNLFKALAISELIWAAYLALI